MGKRSANLLLALRPKQNRGATEWERWLALTASSRQLARSLPDPHTWPWFAE